MLLPVAYALTALGAPRLRPEKPPSSIVLPASVKDGTTLGRAAYEFDVPAEGLVSVAVIASNPQLKVELRRLDDSVVARCTAKAGTCTTGAMLPPGRYRCRLSTRPLSNSYFSFELGLLTNATLRTDGVSAGMAMAALRALNAAYKRGDARKPIVALSDMSVSSGEKRQWVYNASTQRLLVQVRVAHGEGSQSSSPGFANAFGDVPNSKKSSLGLMRTGRFYSGTYGRSLWLEGLEPTRNGHVRQRSIVVHPWEGADDTYVQSAHEVAPTWGCPGVSRALPELYWTSLNGGALMYFWHPSIEAE